MAEYGKLFSRIWSDPDFTALTARAQQVYAMFCSHSNRNMAGVLPLTLRRWVKSTSDATTENLTAALEELSANKFVVVDWDTEELLVRTFVRNDEVYRQPNLMKSARRYALQVESPTLRWALHDEFSRLPEHKDADDTASTAKALVAGLERTPSEPLPEPFGEPLPEPPGVGGYLSGVREHQHPHPKLAPEDDTAGRAAHGVVVVPEFIDNAATPAKRYPSSAAKTVVRQELGSAGYPRTTIDRLAVQVDKLARDHPDAILRAALHEWDRRTDCDRPEFLPTVLGDVVKRSRAAPSTIGKPTQKALGWEQAGAELLAEMEGPQ